MEHDPVNRVLSAIDRSTVVRAAQSVRRDGGIELAVGNLKPRALFPEEIIRLEGAGNQCADWSGVRVVEGFDYRRVRQSVFQGDVVLGRFAGQVNLAANVEAPAGVYASTVADCVIGNDALVQDVRLLANVVVGEGALLFDCGRIVCEGETTFGNGFDLPLAIETGGREVPVHAEIDVGLAEIIALRRSDTALLTRHRQAVADYAARVRSTKTIIEREAVIRHTPHVRNSYIGPHAVIDGATLVADTTLLSNREEPARIESRACVTESILQWGAVVRTLAIVERSVLTEHSSVERHGKVMGSLLGPGTGVAEGEVAASLVGPLVGFHHQALLIAALWPEGRGNVSHGANVGSNHTSRAPDQEFWPGEGAFFGLGVNIKYPSDFSQAPYTLVATATTTLPQKLGFPFSLITPASAHLPNVPLAFNEMIPAWLLSDNLYALKRNEKKFRDRYPGRRWPLESEIFRPDTVDLMRSALHRLEQVTAVKDVYQDKDIEGLGKNYMLEANRLRAIASYRFHILLYALLGLKDRVALLLEQGSDLRLEHLLVMPTNQARWEHQRRILIEEWKSADVVSALRHLPAMLEKVASDVEHARRKDDERGRNIIDDYADVHVPAEEDPLVGHTWQETRQRQGETEDLIARLSQAGWVRVG
ncbi:MAG: DUF4954 family protein [Gemmataceae bacterium]